MQKISEDQIIFFRETKWGGKI